MVWRQPGDGEGPRGPWSRGPDGGGRMPPDLNALLHRLRARLVRVLPGGAMTAGGIALVVLAVIAVWLLSGIYFVTAREQGVVLRFGQFVARTPPGARYGGA